MPTVASTQRRADAKAIFTRTVKEVSAKGTTQECEIRGVKVEFKKESPHCVTVSFGASKQRKSYKLHNFSEGDVRRQSRQVLSDIWALDRALQRTRLLDQLAQKKDQLPNGGHAKKSSSVRPSKAVAVGAH